MGKCCLSIAKPVAPPRLRRRCGGRLVGMLACLWLWAGCAQQHYNRYIYLRGEVPKPLIKAKEAGTYVLVRDDSLTPKYSIELAVGDPYGFRKREDDTIVAVAKDKEIELGDRYSPFYYWLKKNDPSEK